MEDNKDIIYLKDIHKTIDEHDLNNKRLNLSLIEEILQEEKIPEGIQEIDDLPKDNFSFSENKLLKPKKPWENQEINNLMISKDNSDYLN